MGGRCRAAVLGLCTAAVFWWSSPDGQAQNASPAAPRQPAPIEFARLKPDAVIPFQLEPGAAATADALWLPQRAGKTVVRVDAKSNEADAPVPVGHAPCASLTTLSGSLWVPLCEAGRVARVDLKAGNVSASAPLPVTTPSGSIAAAVGSVWLATEAKGVVSRVDPDTNAPVAEAYVARNPSAIIATDEAVWVTSEEGDLLTRIDPHTNAVVATVKVGPRPGRLALSEGAVWILNRGDGSVSRVDGKTNKVITSVAIGADVAAGDIAAGEGSVWISAPGVPIVRIDPVTNRVVQRFTGAGGGAIVIAHGSVWVAAGPSITWRVDPRLIAAMRPD